MLNLNQIVFSLFSGLVCLTASAQVKFPVAQPTLKVGDVAKYRTVDLWRNTELSRTEIELLQVSDEKLVARMTSTAASAPQTLTYNRFWNPCRSLEYSNNELCSGALKFPMQVGAKHEYEKRPWANGGGYDSMKCEVKGEEMVTLAAGTFDTLRVECVGFWTDTTTGSALRFTGRTSEVVWYAPAYNRTVKEEFIAFRSTGLPDVQRRTELTELLPGK